MKDFIIVGHGLAAHVLMHTFKKHTLTFTVVGNENLSTCSRVAAGIWNPVVFKRSTKSWLADELIPELNDFYSACEITLGQKFLTQRPIIKPFTEEQEKTLWLKKSQTDLAGFTENKIYDTVPPEMAHCNIPNGYGLVQQSGNLDVRSFLDASTAYFKENFCFETFDHALLEIFADRVRYRETEARQIIFCEGYLVKNNPFFSWIPLKPAKGEIVTLEAPDLALKNKVFNKNGFLMDIAGGSYLAGATYEWRELNDKPTEKGLAEITAKLAEMLDYPYTVTKHEAGVRPSAIDRRPIIGTHPEHKNLFVFNGLGTKGVMLAPYFAKKFVLFYLQKEPLNPEVDLSRFYRFYGA